MDSRVAFGLLIQRNVLHPTLHLSGTSQAKRAVQHERANIRITTDLDTGFSRATPDREFFAMSWFKFMSWIYWFDSGGSNDPAFSIETVNHKATSKPLVLDLVKDDYF